MTDIIKLFFILFLSHYVICQQQPSSIKIKQMTVTFIPEIPDSYSITQSIIYPSQQQQKSIKSFSKDYYVHKLQSQDNQPLQQPNKLQQPTKPQQTHIQTQIPHIQTQNTKIPQKLTTVQFQEHRQNSIQFKAKTVNTNLINMNQYSIVNPNSVEPQQQPKFQNNLRTNQKPNLTFGNKPNKPNIDSQKTSSKQKQFKFVFSVLLFIAVLVVLFGFPKKDKNIMTPVRTEDEDEQNVLR